MDDVGVLFIYQRTPSTVGNLDVDRTTFTESKERGIDGLEEIGWSIKKHVGIG